MHRARMTGVVTKSIASAAAKVTVMHRLDAFVPVLPLSFYGIFVALPAEGQRLTLHREVSVPRPDSRGRVVKGGMALVTSTVQRVFARDGALEVHTKRTAYEVKFLVPRELDEYPPGDTLDDAEAGQ